VTIENKTLQKSYLQLDVQYKAWESDTMTLLMRNMAIFASL